MRTLRPPTHIEDRYAVLVYSREEAIFILALPNGVTYELGDSKDTMIALRNLLGEDLGTQAMDVAFNFGAAQVIPAQKRVIQVDIGSQLLDKHILDILLERQEKEGQGVLCPLS